MFSSGAQSTKITVGSAEVAGSTDEGFVVVVLHRSRRQLQEAKTFQSLDASYLNALPVGTVVVVAAKQTGLHNLEPRAAFALHRCGARKVAAGLSHLVDRGYALIGVVGGEALAEVLAEDTSSVAFIEMDLPDAFVAAPMVDLTASFVTSALKDDPFPKERPVKPELLTFAAKQPKYDTFCDLRSRDRKSVV